MSVLSDYEEALQQISKAEGRYNMDPNEHAKNCIIDMQKIAINVLKKHGIVPKGKPVIVR